jgi:hypothetical protein
LEFGDACRTQPALGHHWSDTNPSPCYPPRMLVRPNIRDVARVRAMALSPRALGLTSRAEGEINATSGHWSHRKGRRQSHREAARGPPVARGTCH